MIGGLNSQPHAICDEILPAFLPDSGNGAHENYEISGSKRRERA